MGCNCSGGAKIKRPPYFWEVFGDGNVQKEKPVKKTRKKKTEEPKQEEE